MKTRLALVVMGMWLMGSIASSVVATENFYTVDRMLTGSTNVEFYRNVQKLGFPQTRELLRYLSSELNRLYFRIWNVAQLVLGPLALRLIWRRARPFGFADWGLVAMLAIVLLMLGYLTPAIVSLGRALDFVPRDPAPPGMSRFWILHAVYTTLEMVKLAVGCCVTWFIARRTDG
ncbi:MAG: hypothetical protein LAO77_08445 [Acidobacteriia bacterium]|nr:hypothetical protein [Terriglobia bacterium]